MEQESFVDKMLKYTKERTKSNPEIVMEFDKKHANKKLSLGSRVQILRILVCNKYANLRLTMNEFDFRTKCEAAMDTLLFKYDYQLEKLIDHFRALYPLPDVELNLCDCGYRPPICNCGVAA